MRFAAVTFDAYGTLFAGGSDDLIAMMRRVVAENRLATTTDALLERREEMIAELARERFHKMRERDHAILTRLFRENGLSKPVGPYVAPLYRTYFNAQLYPDARAALDGLVRAHVPLAILSNCDDDMMRELLHRSRLDGGTFRAVITSEAAAAYKPARRIFALASERLGVARERILHVGDSYVADVQGAKAAGFAACWLARPGGLPPPEKPESEPDFTVRTLAELPRLVLGA
ncbi:MAG: HAD family hydrolase [Thermoplasmatota archaeon]